LSVATGGSLVIAGAGGHAGGGAAAGPYPNPVSGDLVSVPLHLSADAAEVRLRLYNMRMQRVYASTWRDVGAQETLTMDGMDRLPPGHYLLTVDASLRDGRREAARHAKVLVAR